jgi:hypothetical protein
MAILCHTADVVMSHLGQTYRASTAGGFDRLMGGLPNGRAGMLCGSWFLDDDTRPSLSGFEERRHERCGAAASATRSRSRRRSRHGWVVASLYILVGGAVNEAFLRVNFLGRLAPDFNRLLPSV